MPYQYPPPNQLTQLEAYEPLDYPIPGVPVDKRACRLLGPTALIVQALMGTLVIASLIYKRQREKPMRPWRIWLFDVSKQVLGQAFVHGMNLLISDFIANVAQGNPCHLYFLNILLDTTFGVGYIYLVLHGVNVLTSRLNLKGFQSGEYGEPPSISYWARQAAVYVFTILTLKLLIIGLFAILPGIFDVAEWLLKWTGGKDSIQVIFVMGIFPIVMNILQFWLIDSIVKAKALSHQARRSTGDPAYEPLFNNNESDNEGDETIRARRRVDVESPPTPQVIANRPEQIDGPEVNPTSPSAPQNKTDSSITRHSYPPGSSTFTSHQSSPSSASSSTSSMTSFRSKKSNRRSPPPPIRRPPPHHLDRERYTISMSPSPPPPVRQTSRRSLSINSDSSALRSQARQRHRAKDSQGKSSREPEVGEQWKDWADGDWAEKVEEEDWAAHRMEARKLGVDAWGAKNTIQVI